MGVATEGPGSGGAQRVLRGGVAVGELTVLSSVLESKQLRPGSSFPFHRHHPYPHRAHPYVRLLLCRRLLHMHGKWECVVFSIPSLSSSFVGS